MDQARDAADRADEIPEVQPARVDDATVVTDPDADPAQVEWERAASDSRREPDPDAPPGAGGPGEDDLDPDATTNTGRDPAEIPDLADQVPAVDIPSSELQPETQHHDPVIADIGPDGEGDLAPNDV